MPPSYVCLFAALLAFSSAVGADRVEAALRLRELLKFEPKEGYQLTYKQNVQAAFKIQHISVDAPKQELKLEGKIWLSWHRVEFSWDPKHYSNLTWVALDHAHSWTPPLNLLNEGCDWSFSNHQLFASSNGLRNLFIDAKLVVRETESFKNHKFRTTLFFGVTGWEKHQTELSFMKFSDPNSIYPKAPSILPKHNFETVCPTWRVVSAKSYTSSRWPQTLLIELNMAEKQLCSLSKVLLLPTGATVCLLMLTMSFPAESSIYTPFLGLAFTLLGTIAISDQTCMEVKNKIATAHTSLWLCLLICSKILLVVAGRSFRTLPAGCVARFFAPIKRLSLLLAPEKESDPEEPEIEESPNSSEDSGIWQSHEDHIVLRAALKAPKKPVRVRVTYNDVIVTCVRFACVLLAFGLWLHVCVLF